MNDEDEQEAEGGVERCDINSDNRALLEHYLEQDAHEYPGRHLTVITYGLQRDPLGRRQGQADAPTIHAVRREVHRQWQNLGSRVTGGVLQDQPNDEEAPNPYVVIIALIGEPQHAKVSVLHEIYTSMNGLPATCQRQARWTNDQLRAREVLQQAGVHQMLGQVWHNNNRMDGWQVRRAQDGDRITIVEASEHHLALPNVHIHIAGANTMLRELIHQQLLYPGDIELVVHILLEDDTTDRVHLTIRRPLPGAHAQLWQRLARVLEEFGLEPPLHYIPQGDEETWYWGGFILTNIPEQAKWPDCVPRYSGSTTWVRNTKLPTDRPQRYTSTLMPRRQDGKYKDAGEAGYTRSGQTGCATSSPCPRPDITPATTSTMSKATPGNGVMTWQTITLGAQPAR